MCPCTPSRKHLLAALLGLVLLIGIPVVSGVAQPAPMKWGGVPPEDMEMGRFPADPDAQAVILADYGEVTFDDEMRLIFKRHCRVKLLSEAAFERWGTVELQYYAAKGYQRLEGLEGQTLNLTSTGKVERLKLDKKAVFEEKLDKEWRRVRFALPGLKAGSVIEYRYTISTEDPSFLSGWQFQYDEPVRWSEYRAHFPRRLAYAAVHQGDQPFHISESDIKMHAEFGQLTAARWVMKDVPALREEPYVTTAEDFRSKIRFQLAYLTTTSGRIDLLTSWDQLASALMNSVELGKQIGSHRIVREQAEQVVSGHADPAAKLCAVYDWVRQNISPDGRGRVDAGRSLSQVLTGRTGTATESALLLTSMLHDVGLDAGLVLLSTRTHGQITRQWPMVDQFDYVVTYAKAGNKEYLLDATDPLRPCGLLPFEALNGTGLLLQPSGFRWISLSAGGRHRRVFRVAAQLTAEGDLEGDIESVSSEYAGVEARQSIPRVDQREHIERMMLADMPGARLESWSISQLDSVDKPLVVKAHFVAPGFAKPAGDLLYVNSVLVARVEENPLKSPERKFPVDLGYPRESVYSMELRLPEGYAVEESPPNVNLQLPVKGGRLRRVVQAGPDRVEMLIQVSLDKPRYESREYKDLRELHDRLAAAHSDVFVLRRTAAAAH